MGPSEPGGDTPEAGALRESLFSSAIRLDLETSHRRLHHAVPKARARAVRRDGPRHQRRRVVGLRQRRVVVGFFFFLASAFVGIAPALATGPGGTTDARSAERGANTPDKRWNGKRGVFHAAAVTTAGVYMWGSDRHGEFGDGLTTSIVPAPELVPALATFTKLVLRNSSTCGLTAGSRMSCWGDNSYGALGDDTTNQSPVPVPVAWP